jgi:hypothetical protein
MSSSVRRRREPKQAPEAKEESRVVAPTETVSVPLWWQRRVQVGWAALSLACASAASEWAIYTSVILIIN